MNTLTPQKATIKSPNSISVAGKIINNPLKLQRSLIQGSHAFVYKKFPTFSLPKFAQNKVRSSHLEYSKLQLS